VQYRQYWLFTIPIIIIIIGLIIPDNDSQKLAVVSIGLAIMAIVYATHVELNNEHKFKQIEKKMDIIIENLVQKPHNPAVRALDDIICIIDSIVTKK
jgi:ABC-type bacteriocin/lantibiotic exporter with double-glycine peptidase domain